MHEVPLYFYRVAKSITVLHCIYSAKLIDNHKPVKGRGMEDKSPLKYNQFQKMSPEGNCKFLSMIVVIR